MLTALAATLLLAQGSPNLVVATGSAELTLPADSAVVRITASSTDTVSDAAKQGANSLLVRAKMAAPSSTLFGEASVGANAEFGTPSANGGLGPSAPLPVKDYVGYAWIEARGVPFDRADAMVKAVGAVDGASASVTEYGVKDEGAARRIALKAAFVDAKTKAQEAADAAGLKLGAVYLLDAGNGATLRSGFEAFGSPGVPGYRVTPTKFITARANVTVRFFLVG